MTTATFVRDLSDGLIDASQYLYRLSEPIAYEAIRECTACGGAGCRWCIGSGETVGLEYTDHVVVLTARSALGTMTHIYATDSDGNQLSWNSLHAGFPNTTPAQALCKAGYDVNSGPSDRREVAR